MAFTTLNKFIVIFSLFLSSCSSIYSPQPMEPLRTLASSPDSSCIDLANAIVKKTDNAAQVSNATTVDFSSMAAEIEDVLNNQFVGFRKMFLFKMPSSTKLRRWSFRAKSSASIEAKLKKNALKGKPMASKEDALASLGDGLGARVIFTRTNNDPNNLTDQFKAFVDEFSELLKRGEFKLTSIENYHSDEMQPYLSDAQVEKILGAARSNGDQPSVKSGANAIRETGYTSVHINILLKNGLNAEIQLRDSMIDNMSEISHLFYDFKSMKETGESVLTNPGLKRGVDAFSTMSPDEISEYTRYLENVFELVIDYSDNGSVTRSMPQLTGRLGTLPEIRVEKLAEAYGYKRVQDFFLNPTTFREKPSYATFDSVDYLMDNYPLEVARKVIGNVSQGEGITFQGVFINPERRKLEKDLKGLNYVAAIPWEESSYLKKRRGIIRANRKDPTKPKFRGNILMPKYQEGQFVGEDKISIKQILYMQDSADNNSGQYTVIGNARSLKDGSLKVSDLPPLTVWRDETGRIWSLDHRRLVAFELSGVVDEVPVRFATKEEVQGDFYKFSNADEGRSIVIQLNDSPMAYVLAK